MDLDNQSIMLLIQQEPPPPPPASSPPPPPPDSTPPPGKEEEEQLQHNQQRSSDNRTGANEKEEGGIIQPQLIQTRTLSAPEPASTFGYFFNSPPTAILYNPPSSIDPSSMARKRNLSTSDGSPTYSLHPPDPKPMSRKRAHSTSEESPRRAAASPAADFELESHPKTSELPPMYIQNENGDEEIDPAAYLARGFGWVSATHHTREQWIEFVEKMNAAADKEEYPEPSQEFLNRIDEKYPGWKEAGYSVRVRSRSNSRSRDCSPERSLSLSPVRKLEEEAPGTPMFHSSCTPSPTESPFESPVPSPVQTPAPIEKVRSSSVSRSPRSDSEERFRSRSQSPVRNGNNEGEWEESPLSSSVEQNEGEGN